MCRMRILQRMQGVEMKKARTRDMRLRFSRSRSRLTTLLLQKVRQRPPSDTSQWQRFRSPSRTVPDSRFWKPQNDRFEFPAQPNGLQGHPARPAAPAVGGLVGFSVRPDFARLISGSSSSRVESTRLTPSLPREQKRVKSTRPQSDRLGSAKTPQTTPTKRKEVE